MTIKDLDRLKLAKGKHNATDDEVCLIEAATVQDDLPFSDSPPEYCRVLAAFGRRWNDDLDTEGRQTLKRFLDDGTGHSRFLGTGNDGHQEARAWLATDWLVRVYTPAWLDLAGVKESPAALRALPPLRNTADAQAAQKLLAAAWAAARDAARAAAWAAARDAARAAAGAAARAAAGDAAWAAARAAARASAGAAARAAAWDAAGAAARAAAGAAAGDAAWAAARAAAGDAARDAARAAARAAAGDAARDALKPTVVSLQESALTLLDDMLALGADER